MGEVQCSTARLAAGAEAVTAHKQQQAAAAKSKREATSTGQLCVLADELLWAEDGQDLLEQQLSSTHLQALHHRVQRLHGHGIQL